MFKLIKIATFCVITSAVEQDPVLEVSDHHPFGTQNNSHEEEITANQIIEDVADPIDQPRDIIMDRHHGEHFADTVPVENPHAGEVHEEQWLEWFDQPILINSDVNGKDWEFARAFLSDIRLKTVVQNLSNAQKGKLERGLVSVSGLGERAAREADRLRDEDRIPRKNMMNHFRSRGVKIMTDWCEPNDSWFCSERFLYESLVFIDRKFCSIYDKEMRREVCFPEAQSDFNRAKLRIIPISP